MKIQIPAEILIQELYEFKSYGLNQWYTIAKECLLYAIN